MAALDAAELRRRIDVARQEGEKVLLRVEEAEALLAAWAPDRRGYVHNCVIVTTGYEGPPLFTEEADGRITPRLDGWTLTRGGQVDVVEARLREESAMTTRDALIFGTGIMLNGKRIDPASTEGLALRRQAQEASDV